jgi:hypothetical protein
MPITRAEFLRAAQVLGLPPNGDFSGADVQSQYRKVMQAWHPDHNPEWRDEADTYAKDINAAKDLLLRWIQENKPAAQEERDRRSEGQGGRQPPPPGRTSAAKSPSGEPSDRFQALSDRVFAFYWKAGFLPHWRILFLPLAIVILVWLARSGGDVPKEAAAIQRPSVPASPPPTVTPEISSTAGGWTVIEHKESPRPGFMPDLPALTSKYPLPLTVIMAREGPGAIQEMLVQKIDRTYELGKISAYPDKIRDAISADMRSVIAQGGAVLECRYGTGQSAGPFKIYYYWYKFRPPEADPAHARALAADHPFLRLRAPLYTCPPSTRQAEDSSW